MSVIKKPEIYIPRPTREIVASSAGIVLDGSLSAMTGSDCTEALQAIIDQYTPYSYLKLIIDGVALVNDLKIRSGLHIQGEGPHTGFSQNFSTSKYPCALRNANWRSSRNNEPIIDEDIIISDLTINGNRDNGVSGNPEDKRFTKENIWIMGTRFYGVRRFQMINSRIIDPATYGLGAANLEWFNIHNCEFIHTEFMKGNLKPDFGRGNNVAGMQIQGPACDGTISNIRLATGDDGIALNASDGGMNWKDEASIEHHNKLYWMGPIRRVAISNITSNNSWQIIRLLSGRDEVFGTGMVATIDDITISNVNGVCCNYAIGMERWPDAGVPDFGKISISHVNVEHRGDGYIIDPSLWDPNGKPGTPFSNLFFIGIGGNCKQILLSDIKRDALESTQNAIHVTNGATIQDLIISNLCVSETSAQCENPGPMVKIGGFDEHHHPGIAIVECLTLRDPHWIRSSDFTNDAICEVVDGAIVKRLMIFGGVGKNIGTLVQTTGGTIEEVVAVGNSPGGLSPVIRNSSGVIKKVTIAATSGVRTSGEIGILQSDGTGD